MSLVSVADVTDLTFLFGGATDSSVQAALDWASASVESYCERSFAQVVDDIVLIDPRYTSRSSGSPFPGYVSGYSSAYSFWAPGSGGVSSYGGAAMLPNPPVTAISLVEALLPIEGTMTWTPLTSYAWASDGYIWDTTGIPTTTNGDGPSPSWPTMPRSLRVTYTHGFTAAGSGEEPELPTGITSAIVKAASFFLQNPTGALSEKTGDVSTSWAASSAPSGVLDDVLLGQYRLVNL